MTDSAFLITVGIGAKNGPFRVAFIHKRFAPVPRLKWAYNGLIIYIRGNKTGSNFEIQRCLSEVPNQHWNWQFYWLAI